MGFNSAFNGLKVLIYMSEISQYPYHMCCHQFQLDMAQSCYIFFFYADAMIGIGSLQFV